MGTDSTRGSRVICKERRGNKKMKKTPTKYTLEDTDKSIVKIFKDGKPFGFGTIGVTSALEAIFINENGTKEDWFIVEGNEVFKVNRHDLNIAKDSEEIYKE